MNDEGVFESLGSDELDNLFKIEFSEEDMSKESVEVDLHHKKADIHANVSMSPEAYNNRYVYHHPEEGLLTSWSYKPTKTVIRKTLEELSNELSEEDTEEESVVEDEVEENSTESTTEAAEESMKAETTQEESKNFEVWWANDGERLLGKGFSKKSIMVQCASFFWKERNPLFTEVIHSIGGPKEIQDKKIREICRDISKVDR